MPDVIVLYALICARSSEYHPERDLHARSGECIISDPRAGPAGHEMVLRQAAVSLQTGGSAGQIRGSDPRVGRKQVSGHGDLTRE